MIKQKKKFNYQRLTFILAILIVLTLIFHTIPNYEQNKYDRFCKAQGLDYANVDWVFAKFECCEVYEVSDWDNNQTLYVEGCSSSFDFEEAK